MGVFKNEIVETKLREHYKEEEERLMQYLSERYNLPYLILSDVSLEPDALQMIKEERAKEGEFVVFKRLKKNLFVATRNHKNPILQESLQEFKKRGFSVKLHLISRTTLNRLLSYYQDIKPTIATTSGTFTITGKEFYAKSKEIRSIEQAREFLKSLAGMSSSRRISKNVEYILTSAMSLGASDIHIEPNSEGGAVRYRLDGVLVTIVEFSPQEMKQLITRIKLVAGMKINIITQAQDGSFVVQLPDHAISVRASTVPQEVGESFVLRLLDPNTVLHEIEKLGLHKIVLETFQEEIKKPHGMIITTGPTGSGKTTTLYSFLNAVKSPGVKIITLEDPVEYRLPGIIQTQIEKKYTFASGLRAILRQDPDIILVGEIRDEEVAGVAIQASLTGHMVFSTLHTNDAIGTLPRLVGFGVDPKSLSQALNLVIAQRLVRKLCPHCSEKQVLNDEQKKKVNNFIAALPDGYKTEKLSFDTIREVGPSSKTCERCVGGYKGRVGVFETFRVGPEEEMSVIQGATTKELQDVIKKQGLPFMHQDGLYKVLTGVTSFAELGRVLGLYI